MKKSAFTMLELVMVIVVLGILASMAMPRLDRDVKQEGADNVLSAIRYTQHMALIDNKQLFDDERWQRRFWRIMFAQCSDGTAFYRVGSDDNMNSTSTFEQSEAAIDLANGLPMYAYNNADCDEPINNIPIDPNILIGRNYGLTMGNGTGGCAGKNIGFDHLGRPHVGFSGSGKPDSSSYMKEKCTFKFTLIDGDYFEIGIEPETGYTYIVGQEDS